jgi:hypothetical protein
MLATAACQLGSEMNDKEGHTLSRYKHGVSSALQRLCECNRVGKPPGLSVMRGCLIE